MVECKRVVFLVDKIDYRIVFVVVWFTACY